MLEDLNIPTVPLRPSLVGYITKEKFSDLSGITIKNVKSNDLGIEGDILFTHKGISGPLIYKISSLKARENFPFVLEFDLISRLNEFQKLLEKNSHKLLKNLLSEFLPKSFCQYFVENKGIEKLVCSQVTKNIREDILTSLHKFKVNVIETNPDGETVRAGGVDLNSLNPKTLESKSIEGLYFCGEILNIDGFCGGFNLQNCWSSAFVVQEAIHQTFNLNTPNI